MSGLETRSFPSFEAYQEITAQDRHSILVDFDTFEHVSIPDKADPQRLYDPKDYDFRLKRGSKAIDAGEVLPNITDGYAGQAPDLGAYERGQDVPHYGPRPRAD
jgi:acetyl-CoA carboxylase beta subunit